VTERYGQLDAKIGAIDDAIRLLRLADKWRIWKRNKVAIATLEATRQRILVEYVRTGDGEIRS
jgi:hypothetical protein